MLPTTTFGSRCGELVDNDDDWNNVREIKEGDNVVVVFVVVVVVEVNAWAGSAAKPRMTTKRTGTTGRVFMMMPPNFVVIMCLFCLFRLFLDFLFFRWIG